MQCRKQEIAITLSIWSVIKKTNWILIFIFIFIHVSICSVKYFLHKNGLVLKKRQRYSYKRHVDFEIRGMRTVKRRIQSGAIDILIWGLRGVQHTLFPSFLAILKEISRSFFFTDKSQPRCLLSPSLSCQCLKL